MKYKLLAVFTLSILNFNAYSAEDIHYKTAEEITENQTTVAATITPLMQAIADGNLEIIDKELKQSKLVYINTKDAHGKTALYWAIMYNNIDVVKKILTGNNILEIGFGSDIDGFSPFMQAIESNNTEIIKEFLHFFEKNLLADTSNFQANAVLKGFYSTFIEKPDKLGYSPIMRAAALGNDDVINLLLSKGVKTDGKIKINDKETEISALDLAKSKKQKTAIDLLEKWNRTDEFIKIIEAFINKKYDFDIPLSELEKKALQLFEIGLNINNPQLIIQAIDIYNFYPDFLRKLIANDVNVNVAYKDVFPLHEALLNDYKMTGGTNAVDCVELLIKAKADVNIKDKLNRTPLMFAIAKNNIDTVQALIIAKADLNVINNYGFTACDLASSLNYFSNSYQDKEEREKIFGLLLKNGANQKINFKWINAMQINFAISIINYDLAAKLLADPTFEIDINAQDISGNTLAHEAARTKNLEILKLLIAKKANINLRNFEGNTVLHCSLNSDARDIIKFLIESGANLNITNNEGQSCNYLLSICPWIIDDNL